MSETEPETIWLYGMVDCYHDASCKCPHHCGNCFDDIRRYQATSPRRRYCSDYCQGRAARERALDRLLGISS